MQPRSRPGGNALRGMLLWELAIEMTGDGPAVRSGDRDIAVAVGSGSGDRFEPQVRLATGSPLLAHDVVNGGLEVALINPSGCLTQAYRGTGLFAEALPVRALASYPSWDRFTVALHERTGITSMAQIKERRYPLRLSIRESPAHSTRFLIDQILEVYGFSLADIESWGGSIQLIGPPRDPRRLEALAAGELDAIFDEGVNTWLPQALAAGMRPVALEENTLRHLEAIGWRRAVIPAGRYTNLDEDHTCVDFSGWLLYTRAALPDETAYRACAALYARADVIPWDTRAYTGIDQIGRDTDVTPLDVPLHPGAERWYRERGSL